LRAGYLQVDGMSDKPIQVGDIVMVVRWDGCAAGPTRVIFEVTQIATNDGFACHVNHRTHWNEKTCALGGGVAVPVRWLKRLDPDALKDDVPEHEELVA
jgi:hypothetical protein